MIFERSSNEEQNMLLMNKCARSNQNKFSGRVGQFELHADHNSNPRNIELSSGDLMPFFWSEANFSSFSHQEMIKIDKIDQTLHGLPNVLSHPQKLARSSSHVNCVVCIAIRPPLNFLFILSLWKAWICRISMVVWMTIP